MEVQKIEVSLEEFKCRIPALFPYLEWNEDGTVETHLATDVQDGSYGKVVDNMKTPRDVRLTNYVQVTEDEVHGAYAWNNANTIGMSGNLERYFATSGSSYLRKVVWYDYVKTDEEFPDAELFDSVPTVVSDDSPEEIKTLRVGLDGSVVGCEGVTLYDYYYKNATYYYYMRTDIIKPCETYSYRTIINEYYRYRDIVGRDNSFIKFVEDGIGYIVVDRRLLNLEDEEKYRDVPEFVYLSQVKKLKSKYDEYRKAYIHYHTYYEANNKTSVALKEKADKYILMGGDNFTNWLGQMVQKAYDIADYYKCRADNKDFPTRFTSNVMLSKRTGVMGFETVYDNTFVPGNRYYDGDLLTYEGVTHICQLDRVIPGGNNYPYIKKTKEIDGVFVNGLFMLDGNSYTLISNANISYVPSELGVPSIRSTDYIVVDSQYYKWNGTSYSAIHVTEYSTGLWDDETERYVFDYQHFIPLSELEGYSQWYDVDNLYGEDLKYFVDLDYIPSYRVYDYIRFNGGIFEWDTEQGAYVASDGDENIITETTNSKLRDLRLFREYVNPFGTSEEPGMDEDWLYYYKVGNITGKVVETDSLGNIVSDSPDFIPNETCYDLHAYGNVIISITYDADSDTVTFVYATGAHLLAVADSSYTDEDGNVIRRYSDFSYDEYSGDGVVFTETYKCKDASIGNLGSDFQGYVEGDVSTMMRHAYEKLPFETVPVTAFDGSVSIQSHGVAAFDVYGNMQHSRTVRKDWMQGLYHQPKVQSSLSIDRGNGASFDRHVRLGEIHTMEDFENYQNGGFFKLSEN